MDSEADHLEAEPSGTKTIPSEMEEILVFLQDCEECATEDVHKKISNLHNLLTASRGSSTRHNLTPKVISHIEIFRKFWFGVTDRFETKSADSTYGTIDRKRKKNILKRRVRLVPNKEGISGSEMDLSGTDQQETLSVQVLVAFLDCFLELTDFSDPVCRAFGVKGYLEQLFTRLRSKRLAEEIISRAVGIIYNCCRRIPQNRPLCKAEIATLQDLSRSHYDDIQANAYLALSYIVDEAQAHMLDLNKACIKFLLSTLEEKLDNPGQRGEGYSVEEIAQGIRQLAINGNNKRLIAKKGAIRLMERILTNASSTEKEMCFAAQAILQMAFDTENQGKIRKRKDLIKALDKYELSSNPDLSVACSRTLLMIEEDIKEFHGDEDVVNPIPRRDGHIMISYQHESQGTMLQVKEYLQKEGYTVWTDVEKMRGDILEGMAKAVQESAVVLLCMTLNFKESQNCMTEANYAYKLKKDIIPLMLEEGYVPEDWLGALLGMKKYFAIFTDELLSRNLPNLVIELGDRGKAMTDTIVTSPEAPIKPVLLPTVHAKRNKFDEADNSKQAFHTHGQLKSKTQTKQPNSVQPKRSDALSVKEWNTEQVHDWLRTTSITATCSNKSLSNVNGVQLVQIYSCLGLAPEYCTSSLRTELGLGFLDVVAFIDALQTLF